MKEPFIFLYSEINKGDDLTLANWTKDEEVVRFLSDTIHTASAIKQVIDRICLLF